MGSHFPLELRPSFPKKLPGSLWGITAYFNPLDYKTRRKNYLLFRERSKKQGLKLIAVEAALNDAPFQLTKDDADILVQVRTHSMLWQKERLINIGSEHLPDDCDKVVILDADVLFADDLWVQKLSKKLESFIAAQPMRETVHLAPGQTEPLPDLNGEESAAFTWPTSTKNLFRNFGHTGHAFAARRELFDRFGYYDRMVFGGADVLMLCACFGIAPKDQDYLWDWNTAMIKDMTAWAEKVSAYVQGSVAYGDQQLFHLWHGSLKKRFYNERKQIARDFDPHADLRLGKDGCWEWATDKKTMHEETRTYFSSRDEDGANPRTIEDRRIEDLEKELYNARGRYQHYETLFKELASEIDWKENVFSSVTYKIARAMNAVTLVFFPANTAWRKWAVRTARRIMKKL